MQILQDMDIDFLLSNMGHIRLLLLGLWKRRIVHQPTEDNTDYAGQEAYLSHSPTNSSSRILVSESDNALRLLSRDFCLSEWICPS